MKDMPKISKVLQDAQQGISAAVVEITLLRGENMLLIGSRERLERENALLRAWARACRDEVLYPLAHQDTALGAVAEGLGQQLTNLGADNPPR